MLTAIRAAYEYLADGHADRLLTRLLSLMTETHALLLSVCAKYKPPPQLFRINTLPPESPIIPLFSARSRSLAQHCQQRGYMVRPIVAPTVPRGTDRVRLCLHAANTMGEVRGLCMAIEEWLQLQLVGDPDGAQITPVASCTSASVAELSKL
jgi:8-amino-7-oxononanoate synthase